jgi:hypothetical protein
MKLSNIQKDKLLHFFYGTIIAFLTINFSYITGEEALIICGGIAAGKELIYDKIMGRGNCEFMDFVYTFAPAVMFYLTKYGI